MARRFIVGFVLTAGLLGCEPRHPDIDLSEYHPAAGDAHEGRAIAAPAALRPELQTAMPRLLRLPPKKVPPAKSAAKAAAKPAAKAAGGHKMHKM